jgi:hypothetical protein
MGIISDFLKVKQNVDKNFNNKNIKINRILRAILLNNAKRELMKDADKLILANEPLSKNEVLELAQSLHGLSVGYDEGFFDNKVKVEYFAGNESYRLTLLPNIFEGTNIQLFEIVVSSKREDMETLIQIKESEDIIKSNRLNIPTIHTNIKELKDFINICNHNLYMLIRLYLYDAVLDDWIK